MGEQDVDLSDLENQELDYNGERPPDELKFDFHLEEGEDAMTRFGYGIVSYFGLIRTFLLVFLLVFLVNVPVMYLNSQWNGL